jgi:hypothetical protein
MEGDVDRMIRDLVCQLLSSHGPANKDDAGLSATVPRCYGLHSSDVLCAHGRKLLMLYWRLPQLGTMR